MYGSFEYSDNETDYEVEFEFTGDTVPYGHDADGNRGTYVAECELLSLNVYKTYYDEKGKAQKEDVTEYLKSNKNEVMESIYKEADERMYDAYDSQRYDDADYCEEDC